MRLLVCGGAGFIGSTFIRRQLATRPDVQIVNLDKLTYAGQPRQPARRRRRPAATSSCRPTSATGRPSCGAADGVDAIVNFAAETHVDRSIAEPEAFLHTDILGTHTLLEVAREIGVARLLQVSTDEVYGSIAEGSFTEESPDRTLQPLLRVEGGRRPAGPRLPPHLWAPSPHHPGLEHLRPLPVSGEAHTPLRDERP